MREETIVTGFRTTPEERKLLETLADKDSRTLANYVLKVVREHFKEVAGT